jgi:hypothetical protein
MQGWINTRLPFLRASPNQANVKPPLQQRGRELEEKDLLPLEGSLLRMHVCSLKSTLRSSF